MDTSITIKYFQSLSTEEIEDFKKYMKSQYGSKKQLLTVLDAIIKQHPDFEGWDNTCAALYKKIFKQPKKSAWDKLTHKEQMRILVLTYQLTDKLREYIVEYMLDAQPHLKYFILMEYFANRSNPEVYEDVAKKAKKHMSTPHALWQRFLKVVHAESEYSKLRGISTEKFNNFIKLTQQIRYFYQAKMLPYYVELLSFKKSSSHEIPEQAEQAFEQIMLDFTPIHIQDNLFRQLIGLTKQPTFPAFKNLYNDFIDHFDELNSLDKKLLIIYMKNICTRQKKFSGFEQLSEYGEKLSDLALKEGLYNINGKMPPQMFLNTLVKLIKRDDTMQCARDFIDTYSIFLEKRQREKYISAAQALIHVSLEEYSQLLTCTQNLYFKNKVTQTTIQALSLIAYYELNHKTRGGLDFIESKVLSLTRLINNSPISGRTRIAVLNLVQCVKFLTYGEKEKVIKLCKEADFIHARSWVLRKIE